MRRIVTFYGFNLHENDWKYTRIPGRVKSAHFPNTKQQGIVLIETPILFFFKGAKSGAFYINNIQLPHRY